MLSCITPHIGEEIWSILGHNDTIAYESFPTYDEAQLVEDTVEIVCQINGKIKCKLDIPKDCPREEMLSLAKEQDEVKAAMEGKSVVKEIAVPNKLVNIVVK